MSFLRSPKFWEGWGFALSTLVLSCLMLLLNGALITGMYRALYPEGPPGSLQKVKLIQMVLFIAPVAMLFIEWTLFDFGIRRILLPRWRIRAAKKK